MALTKDEFVDKMMLIQTNQKLLRELSNQQKQEVEDLNVEYKVIECNTKREAIAKKYALLAKDITDANNVLFESLGG